MMLTSTRVGLEPRPAPPIAQAAARPPSRAAYLKATEVARRSGPYSYSTETGAAFQPHTQPPNNLFDPANAQVGGVNGPLHRRAPANELLQFLDYDPWSMGFQPQRPLAERAAERDSHLARAVRCARPEAKTGQDNLASPPPIPV